MNDGQRADIQSDDRPDNRWVSFVELAASRGISKDAAHRLVRRKGWRRQSDNRGRVLVLVPVEELAQAEVGRPPNQSDNPPDNRPDNGAIEAMFQAALQAKDASIAAKDDQIGSLKGEIAAKDELIVELRSSVMRAELAHATAQEALRQADEREAHRRSQGRWARLRAAWRGK